MTDPQAEADALMKELWDLITLRKEVPKRMIAAEQRLAEFHREHPEVKLSLVDLELHCLDVGA